jgi:hypothetical protein
MIAVLLKSKIQERYQSIYKTFKNTCLPDCFVYSTAILAFAAIEIVQKPVLLYHSSEWIDDQSGAKHEESVPLYEQSRSLCQTKTSIFNKPKPICQISACTIQ